jgi:hypothetical protein
MAMAMAIAVLRTGTLLQDPLPSDRLLLTTLTMGEEESEEEVEAVPRRLLSLPLPTAK